MEYPPRAQQIARFGVFEVDLAGGELRKHGLKISLQEQPFRLLILLIERQGEVVSREDLRQALWPEDTFVDFEHRMWVTHGHRTQPYSLPHHVYFIAF